MNRQAQPVEPVERRAVERPDDVPAHDAQEPRLRELRRLYLARRGVPEAVRAAIASIAFQVNAARAGE